MPKTEPERSQLLFDSLRYVETLFAHELALIGNRLTWFAVTQSFLFGAYATVATDPARLERAFSVTQPGATQVGSTTISTLLLITPLLGIAIALAGLFSVNAAATVLAHLGRTRGALQIQMNELLKANSMVAIPVLGDKRQRTESVGPQLGRTILWGRMPEWVLPVAMILVWTVALGLRLRVQGITISAP